MTFSFLPVFGHFFLIYVICLILEAFLILLKIHVIAPSLSFSILSFSLLFIFL